MAEATNEAWDWRWRWGSLTITIVTSSVAGALLTWWLTLPPVNTVVTDRTVQLIADATMATQVPGLRVEFSDGRLSKAYAQSVRLFTKPSSFQQEAVFGLAFPDGTSVLSWTTDAPPPPYSLSCERRTINNLVCKMGPLVDSAHPQKFLVNAVTDTDAHPEIIPASANTLFQPAETFVANPPFSLSRVLGSAASVVFLGSLLAGVQIILRWLSDRALYDGLTNVSRRYASVREQYELLRSQWQFTKHGLAAFRHYNRVLAGQRDAILVLVDHAAKTNIGDADSAAVARAIAQTQESTRALESEFDAAVKEIEGKIADEGRINAELDEIIAELDKINGSLDIGRKQGP